MHHIKQQVKKESHITVHMKKNISNSTTTNKKNSFEVETIPFFAGNPMIEITEGRIHLYKNEVRETEKSTVRIRV